MRIQKEEILKYASFLVFAYSQYFRYKRYFVHAWMMATYFQGIIFYESFDFGCFKQNDKLKCKIN